MLRDPPMDRQRARLGRVRPSLGFAKSLLSPLRNGTYRLTACWGRDEEDQQQISLLIPRHDFLWFKRCIADFSGSRGGSGQPPKTSTEGPSKRSGRLSQTHIARDVTYTSDDLSVKRRSAELERQLIQKALERTNGNRSKAGALLELSKTALRYKIREYGLIAPRCSHWGDQ